MTVKSVNITILSNGLGAVPPGGGETIAVVGVSSSGTVDTTIESSVPSDFTDDYGYGPGPQAAGFIAQHGGNSTIFVKSDVTTAGSNSAVTHTGTGASVMTVTGTPNDTYYVVVTVTTGGTVGVAGCFLTVSLDAGRTTYSTITLGTATTYLIPNTGITLNFTAATLVAGDTYTFVSTEPKWNTTQLASAMDALLASGKAFKNVLVVGDISASEAATVKTEMTAFFNKKQFSRAFANARDATWGGTSTETESQWITAITTDFAGLDADRISVSAGNYNVVSPYSQTQFRRPLSWVAAAIDSTVTIGQDISAVALGSLPMISKPANDDGFIYYDAQDNAALDTARFLTAQLLRGKPGWYMTNSNLMAAAGSDFSILPYGEVVDEASRVAYLFFTNYLGGSVRVDSTTGFILAADANDIDARCTAQLQAALGAGVSSIRCVVTRNSNILSTKILTATIQIVPLGYINVVNLTLTFINPALVPV